jgi:hypothetical protein
MYLTDITYQRMINTPWLLALERQGNGESYKLLQNGEILKTYLDEDNLSIFRILTVNDINFNNQNPNIMEKQDFDQVKYLKDQMKYLGFGEGKTSQRFRKRYQLKKARV